MKGSERRDSPSKRAAYRHAIFMIGDTLRKAREKKKISVRDVENETSIRSVYIDAIEKGEYDKLPGEVYAKGFIKNYANFLNLNGEELVRQFVMEISTVAAQEENSISETPKNSINATNVGEKYSNNQQVNSTDFSNFEDDSRKYLVAAVAFIAILISGIFYTFSDSEEENITVAKVETPAPVKETPQVEKAVEVAQVAETPKIPEPVTPVTPPVDGVNLQATFSGDCWTRVIVDGGVAYEGMIVAGQSFDWNGKESVNVLLGNAGAAQFVMNGQSVGAIGAYGDVVEKTFTL